MNHDSIQLHVPFECMSPGLRSVYGYIP